MILRSQKLMFLIILVYYFLPLPVRKKLLALVEKSVWEAGAFLFVRCLIRKSLVYICDKKCFSSFFCVMYGIMFTSI